MTSIVEIVNHNENIYEMLDTPNPEPPKTPIYVSELERQLKSQRKPQLCRDFGYPETPLKPPEQFLKKGEGMHQPIKKSDHKCCTSSSNFRHHLPPVPKRSSSGKKLADSKINFTALNKKKVTDLKVKPIEPKSVDTRRGHVEKLKGSGMIPEYGLRPTFGKVPAYLVKRNMKIQREIENMLQAEEQKESLCKMISEEERQKLLHDLRYKWQELQKAFLQLPVLTDTIPKILKKTRMEQELKRLEKDIDLIESNPYIYIYE